MKTTSPVPLWRLSCVALAALTAACNTTPESPEDEIIIWRNEALTWRSNRFKPQPDQGNPVDPSGGRTSGFVAEYVPTLINPEVVVENRSEKPITMELRKDLPRTMTIAPYSSQSLGLLPGTYHFHASAPGVMPASGVETFASQYRYTWIFTIETVRTPF
jgi:hypothetical protein